MFRDGDFKGIIQTGIQKYCCSKGEEVDPEDAEAVRAEAAAFKETSALLRNSWRLLTINNSLSERMGWVVVASVVVSEYDALGWDTVTSRRELVPIATLGERRRRRRRAAPRALLGLLRRRLLLRLLLRRRRRAAPRALPVDVQT